MHAIDGSMQAGCTHNAAPCLEGAESKEEVLIRVGETAHLRERSKSDSIMWPSFADQNIFWFQAPVYHS